MQVEHRKFSGGRRFGVEMELDPIIGGMQIGRFLATFEDQLGYGKQVMVEVEGNCWAESKKNDFWHVKYDSSCGPTGVKSEGGGWEVASYIGQGRQHIDSIAAAAGFLDVAGAQVNEHCGLHVHVEAADFTVSRMGILLANWVKIEPLLFQACPQRRRRNKHCKSLRKKINAHTKTLARDFYHAMAPVYLGSWENNDKRYTLNIVGFARSIVLDDHSRPTVELRLPEGTLETDDVIGWTTLLLNFIDACSTRSSMPKTLFPASLKESIEILGMGGNDRRFVILDRWNHNTKVWFLKRLVEHATQPGLRSEADKMLAFMTEI